jgi:hypothetical protein
MTETGTYVYAIGRGLDEQRVRGLTGLREAEIRTIEHRGLVAVTSTVDLEEFGESGLRRHLEDIRWLEDVARRHDEVVRRAAAATKVLAPFRLATIYRSDSGVRLRIDELYDELVRALDRIEGRSEWGIKAFGRGQASSADKPQSASADRPASGVAYLERRRAELAERDRAMTVSTEQASELFWELAAGADASRRLAPQDQRLSGKEEPMALNCTFLVDDGTVTVFFQRIEELRRRYPMLTIEVDGPWPPYSFATLEGP